MPQYTLAIAARTYEVLTLDVWGNAKDGYTVNQSFHTGQHVTFADDLDDKSFIDVLDAAVSLPVGKNKRRIKVEVDGDPDFALNVTTERLQYPLCDLEFERKTTVKRTFNVDQTTLDALAKAKAKKGKPILVHELVQGWPGHWPLHKFDPAEMGIVQDAIIYKPHGKKVKGVYFVMQKMLPWSIEPQLVHAYDLSGVQEGGWSGGLAGVRW